MVSSEITVNTGTLYTDAASIRGEIRAMRDSAGNLRRAAVNLNRMWEGEAKAAFLKAYEGELSRLEEAIGALDHFTSLTEMSGTEYERCESAVSDVVSSIRV